MLLSEDSKHPASRFGAGVLWLEDTAAVTVSDHANGAAEAARQDSRVVLPGEGLIILLPGVTGPGVYLRDYVVHQGRMLCGLPKVEAVGDAAPDILGRAHA